MRLFKKKIIYREDKKPYLIRYTTFLTCRWFSVKVHNILLSDHACLHDHPWAFLTFIIKGGYAEHTPEGSKIYGPGSLLYRPAKYTHRLEIHQPTWTVVVTFRKRRPWGFYTSKGWVPWRRYVPSSTCE